MSLLDWFKPKAYTLKDPEFADQASTLFTGSGVAVNPDNALQISAVYGCVRILSETVASLPLRIYRRTPEGREAVDHPLNDILGVSCNGEQTAMEMREFQMSALCLRGNSYAAVRRSNRGGVGAVNPLKPAFSHLVRDGAGRLMIDYQEPGNNATYASGQIWRVAGMGSDGVTGLSPIQLAKENMGLAITAEQSAARVFSNGGQSATTLEFEHQLTEDQIKRLRDQWADNYSGYKNHHKPMILESGMTAKSIGMSLRDTQFIESRKFQIAEIARWYRVPLHMLGELERATFSNIEHQGIEFVVHTVRPWLVRIEQSISRDLLSPSERASGLYASHIVEGLLRGDTKSRYEAYSSAIINGWLNRNEVRKLENLNPAEGLDEYLVPLNMAASGEVVEDLASAENRVLAKEAGKRDKDSFAEWLPGFYTRQSKRISDSLGVDAGEYGATRINRMNEFETPQEAVQAATEHTANDIEALCNE